MTKAIIFDCFGVLVGNSYNIFYDTYLANQPDVVQQIKALDHASSKGSITHDDFYRGVVELTGMDEAHIREFMKQTPPNLELLSYIETELKPHYKIGFLSNVASDMMDELFTKDQQALFDDIVLSYAVDMAKPEVEIFELAAERLGVSTDECVFIDDTPGYLDGASVAGMRTVLYEDFETCRQRIEKELA